jgi:hypothetical protein
MQRGLMRLNRGEDSAVSGLVLPPGARHNHRLSCGSLRSIWEPEPEGPGKVGLNDCNPPGHFPGAMLKCSRAGLG